jgi:RNA polymerase sigma-70 factor, ECF subfamily
MSKPVGSGDLAELDVIVRREGGLVLAALIRMTNNFDLAEDAVQDAVVEALESWPRLGMPANPGAWLTTVAKRRALDRIRREAARRAKETSAVGQTVRARSTWPGAPDESDESDQADGYAADASVGVLGDATVRDDALALLFTCCHPALAPDTQLTLVLRTVAGLSTRDIAAVLLLPEATVGQRISRAKRKITVAGIPFRVPADSELPNRLDTVLSVLYLMFTVGHHATHGPGPVRLDVADEAIRITRQVVRVLPDEAEAAGLLALQVATHARRATRLDAAGDIVLLREQDRAQWDRDAINEASSILTAVLRQRRPGPYQVQAAIACVHVEARTWDETDWEEIVRLYDVLVATAPTDVVRVNRAVAIAERDGASAGLRALEEIAGSGSGSAALQQWHLAWSVRAELLLRCGRNEEAVQCFERALTCAANDADRRHLRRRLDVARAT